MITETTESNLIMMPPLIQRLMVVITLSIFMGGCANSASCIRGDGRWSFDMYGLEDKEIKQGEVIDFFVTFDCWGKYDVMVGIGPRPRFIYGQGIAEDGRNNYYEELPGEDGTVYRKLLGSYFVRSEIEIRSLDNPDRHRITRKEWELPPRKYGHFIPHLIVPTGFSAGERLRIRISLVAEDGFYDKYGSVSMGIYRNMVID